jgi:hypothetical protein
MVYPCRKGYLNLSRYRFLANFVVVLGWERREVKVERHEEHSVRIKEEPSSGGVKVKTEPRENGHSHHKHKEKHRDRDKERTSSSKSNKDHDRDKEKKRDKDKDKKKKIKVIGTVSHFINITVLVYNIIRVQAPVPVLNKYRYRHLSSCV